MTKFEMTKVETGSRWHARSSFRHSTFGHSSLIRISRFRHSSFRRRVSATRSI